ncbi:MAG: hypothetical protein LC769_07020, partial [Chloroflexi bacterium]|nr:hypothetical protein [Chloroflexota bacterium]
PRRTPSRPGPRTSARSRTRPFDDPAAHAAFAQVERTARAHGRDHHSLYLPVPARDARSRRRGQAVARAPPHERRRQGKREACTGRHSGE